MYPSCNLSMYWKIIVFFIKGKFNNIAHTHTHTHLRFNLFAITLIVVIAIFIIVLLKHHKTTTTTPTLPSLQFFFKNSMRYHVFLRFNSSLSPSLSLFFSFLQITYSLSQMPVSKNQFRKPLPPFGLAYT